MNRSGEPYMEHALLAGLEDLLDETALQRRLNDEAAQSRAEEEHLQELHEEQERRIADAKLVQQARLERLKAEQPNAG